MNHLILLFFFSIEQSYIHNEIDVNEKEIPIIDFNDFSVIAKQSVCIIKIKNEKGEIIKLGTGFFIELEIEDENRILQGLITNNHVLNKDQLNLNCNNIFEIYFKEKDKIFVIHSDDMTFIFTEELIDITFIQFKKELSENINPNYLKMYDEECINNDITTVIQYPVDNNKTDYVQKLSFSSEHIEYSSGINYSHKCSTFSASSGSPLVNNSLEVVGIHKSSLPNKNENYATKSTVAKYAICTAYLRRNKNEINNTINVIEELTEDRMEDIKNHNLIKLKDPKDYNLKKLNNNIFKFVGNDYIPSLLYYRTNHAWYWTNQITENYEMKTLKSLKWEIIIPHGEINNEENKSLSLIHRNLIMWLRLSEFMYL